MRNKTINFLNKLQILKNISRSGWDVIAAPKESVAEHLYRTVPIALILAKKLKLNEHEILLLIVGSLFHDLEEIYIGDLHKIAKKYLKPNKNKINKKIISEFPEEIKDYYLEYLKNKKIKQIVKDADKIECALTAKNYNDLGYKTKSWIENTKNSLKLKESKKLFLKLLKVNLVRLIEKEK
ncbi:MAG: HD domain-containing protein [Candidatus Micrarchaeota archaeon]|nr:HD domain-containing protein [Candidatus Micrarchaeota archaeon]